ncbi:alpha-amylase family glycosyl hydrolase [Brevundimonas aurifodinae]|uniref:Alpha-amylase family glycosyl hydrolase n=2 Tax=Brevundimonas TaxID=41275 RepID=A0ABV1NS41_9CAUL
MIQPVGSAMSDDHSFVGGAPALALARQRLRGDLASLYGAARAGALAEALIRIAGAAASARPAPLRALDQSRAADPAWFLSQRQLGYCAYVDRFCGTLANLPGRADWLADLGVTYLHLLPLLKMRAGDNDGGFAVSDFGAVDPRFGGPGDLARAADSLRARGISLCLDLVLNHVADDHPWAQAARAGDAHHRGFFHVLPDDEAVTRAERTLAEVFPASAPGNFTWSPDLGGWVWTTFYPFQWDLNWSNPDVLVAVAEALLDLANQGVESFRLDSVPYLWKRIGTACKDLPETHAVLGVLRTVADLACPGVLLKAEAVTATRHMSRYLGSEARPEAHLAYHNSLMVALWTSLAEETAEAVTDVIARTPAAPEATTWALYARCHDDIGWHLLITDDGPAARPRAEALSAFYGGGDSDFARGVTFQAGSGALATCGMSASLAGLEAAEISGDAGALAAAIARIRLIHALVLLLPGLPILYMGDEIGLLNDPDWRSRDRFAEDERGLNRPFMDWSRAATPVGDRVLATLRSLVSLRRENEAFRADAGCEIVPSGDARVLRVRRGTRLDRVDLLFNLSSEPVVVMIADLADPQLDLVSGDTAEPRFVLEPWAVVALVDSRP